jgi:integrase
MPDCNYKILKKRIKQLYNDDRKPRTIINNIVILIRFSKWCKKSFAELTDEDLDAYWKTLKVKKSTVGLHKKLVKTLLKKVNPTVVEEIKVKRTKNDITPDQLLTDDEVYRLLDAATTARDKAIIACLSDSGARIGELLSTTISDAKFDNDGCLLWLREGKTGDRHTRLIFASSYLRHWMEVHPRKNNPNAPLFCSFRTPNNVISQTGLYDVIRAIKQKTGITKRTNPHMFRHTKATYLAKKLKSEQKIKGILGWKADSTMLSRYVKLSATDIDDAVFEAEGIRKSEYEPTKPKTYRCKRCDTINAITEKFCIKCGYNEDSPTIERIVEEKVHEMIDGIIHSRSQSGIQFDFSVKTNK